MTYHIVTLGDPVADLVIPISHFPIKPQEHQSADDIMLDAGGTGNFLIMASRLGLYPIIIGGIGNDYYGKTIIDIFQSEKINVDHIVNQSSATTSVSIGLITQGKDHVFLWKRPTGPIIEYNNTHEHIIKTADALFTAGHALDPGSLFTPQSVLKLLKFAHSREIPIFFDIGPSAFVSDKSCIQTAIGYANIVLATEEEAYEWTGITDTLKSAKFFINNGAKIAIIKMGPRGCLLMNQNNHVQIPSFNIEVQNTAAAGDAFASGCVYGFLNHYTLTQTGQLANAIGAASASKIGTGSRLPHIKEIIETLTIKEHPIFHLHNEVN